MMTNAHSNTVTQTMTSPPKRVLVIDDEESIRILLKEYFEIIGLDVRAEPSGAEGLKAIAEDEFGLVICDVAMPGMDGFQVFEKVLNIKPKQNFLFMTGFSFEGSRQRLIDKSLGLLRKPFHLNDLNVILEGIYSDLQKC